jgi:D-3-phosphoglycerate dehydrogenase / 2-oxoglutarate reductase
VAQENPPRAGGRIGIADAGYDSYDLEREVAASIGYDLEVSQCEDEDDVIAFGADMDGLIVRLQPVSRRVLSSLPRCRVVARYGTGYDTVDVDAATELGVVVANVVDFGVHEVAEHAVALLLAGARRIVAHDHAVRMGAWDIAQADPIHRISGSTLGLIGFGSIARAVMSKLQGFELRTLVHDPYVPDDIVRGAGAEPADLPMLLATADLVSLHAPLTDETRHMISGRELARMKPSAVLVNTARGGLIDTDALIDALESGLLAAAGLDVHEVEPLPATHPIRDIDVGRAILLDHAGWYSEESIEALQRGAIEAVAAVLTGQRPRSVVNPAVFDAGLRTTTPHDQAMNTADEGGTD